MSSHDSYHADPDSGYETDLRTALITGRSKLLGRRKRQFRWGVGIGLVVVAVTAFGWTQGDRGTTLVADGRQVTTTAPLTPPLEPTITVESVPAPEDWGRFGHGVVFAGAEALIWGGWADEGGTPATPQFLAYSPAGDSWRELTPAPFPTTGYAEVAWTGTELLVVGGQITDGEVADSVGAYDPATDTWRVLDPLPVPKGDEASVQMDAVWDGEHLTVWWPDAGVLAQLSPAAGAWTALSPPTLELGVDGTADLLSLGGTLVAAAGSDQSVPSLAMLDPSGQWLTIEAPDAFTGFRSAVPSDQRLLVAGQSGFDLVSAVWDPATGLWSEPEAVPLASCEDYPEPIPAPDGRVLWWGWCNQSVALFDPASGWTNPPTSADGPIVGPMTTMGGTLLGFPTTSPFGAGTKARWSRLRVSISEAG